MGWTQGGGLLGLPPPPPPPPMNFQNLARTAINFSKI